MGSVLRGDRFLGFWLGKPAAGLAERILYTMPATAPGSLSENEAMDVTLYLLERNGAALPASAGAEALANHIIERAAK